MIVWWEKKSRSVNDFGGWRGGDGYRRSLFLFLSRCLSLSPFLSVCGCGERGTAIESEAVLAPELKLAPVTASIAVTHPHHYHWSTYGPVTHLGERERSRE